MMQYSRTTIINNIYDWMIDTHNFGVVNREGATASIFARRAMRR
jgi:hypothetical protein